MKSLFLESRLERNTQKSRKLQLDLDAEEFVLQSQQFLSSFNQQFDQALSNSCTEPVSDFIPIVNSSNFPNDDHLPLRARWCIGLAFPSRGTPMTTSNNSTPGTRPLTPDDFVQDAPVAAAQAPAATPVADLIDGITVTPLVTRADHRGGLTELLTTRHGPIEPIVHVYEVEAKAGSLRGWVYHRHQSDRLAFTRGRFRVVLLDIRQDSPTFNKLSVLILGKERPGLLHIPPFVVHAVQNLGEDATFINMPTGVYDPRDPDKCRLPIDDPRIPFSFRD